MIASLMMYARPELEGAHARFWALIREELAARGVDSPETLSQEAEEFFVWEHPDLVLSQTCGLPYRTRLCDSVQLVATPDYGLEGCAPGHYRSALVVRADDPRKSLASFEDARLAYNQSFSQSGFAAPYFHCMAAGFWFETRVQTGGHLRSARAVAQGQADIAAIDAQTWRLIVAHEAFAHLLRVLEWTAPTPALPMITGKGQDSTTIAAALTAAHARLPTPDSAALGLRGYVQIPKDAYLAVPTPPDRACC